MPGFRSFPDAVDGRPTISLAEKISRLSELRELCFKAVALFTAIPLGDEREWIALDILKDRVARYEETYKTYFPDK